MSERLRKPLHPAQENTRKFPRRKLLELSAFGVTAGGLEYAKVRKELEEAEEMWERANVSNEQFVADNADLLRRVNIGCSFAPEFWRSSDLGLELLDKAVTDLGFTHIRMAIRWNTVDKDGFFDYSYYEPYLAYLFRKQDIKVTLNIGPNKVFRYPEVYIPKHVLETSGYEMRPTTILEATGEIADKGLAYLKSTCTYLKERYDTQNNLEGIQIDNEPMHPTGETNKVMVSPGLLIREALEVHSHFRDAIIDITAAGRGNFDDTYAFIRSVNKYNWGKDIRFRQAINYYYDAPHLRHLLFGKVDNLFSFPHTSAKTCEQNIIDNDRAGIPTKVTEAQAEPWGSRRNPGNSVVDLRYVLLRSTEKVLQLHSPDRREVAGDIDKWGIEPFLARVYLGDEPLDEHFAMVDLYHRIRDLKNQTW